MSDLEIHTVMNVTDFVKYGAWMVNKYPFGITPPRLLANSNQMYLWCQENFGQEGSDRWMFRGLKFRFATQADASLFMMFWG